MSMCRVISCVVGRGCLLWPVCSLGKTLSAFALLHSVFQGQICLLLQVFLDFLLFIIGDWNAKVGSQEITWSNRQIWPWSTEWSRAKANTVLLRECTSHSKHPLPTTQEKTLHMDITRWSTPKSGWLYPKMEKLYAVSINKTRSWLWLRSWTPYCKI